LQDEIKNSDTLYHAVALERENVLLVTADHPYYRKAERQGMIAALRDWLTLPRPPQVPFIE
jgi:hypothetical protein